MATVIHVLKDGTVKKDITGHVVKVQDAEAVYSLIETINKNNVGKRGAYVNKSKGA